MKKLMMGFAACALLLSSCVKNEVLTNTADSNMISFSHLNDRLTKVAGANDSQSDYGVWAVNNSAFVANLNNNTQVDGITNNYSPKAVWPASGVTNFYAYAPHSSLEGAPSIDGTPSTTSILLSYTVPSGSDFSKQKDFTVVTANSSQTTGEIALEFSHMLCQIKLGTVVMDPTLTGYTVEAASGGYKIKVIAPVVGGDVQLVGFNKNESGWSNLVTKTAADRHRYIGTNFFMMPQPAIGKTVLIQLQNVIIKKDGTQVYAGNIATAAIPAGAVTNSSSVLTDRTADQFNRGSAYTVSFVLGGDVKKEGSNPDEEDPDKPGDPIITNTIQFSTTTLTWVQQPMNMTL